MSAAIEGALGREVRRTDVTMIGQLTRPRSYGVYRLPQDCGATRGFRFGNHPVRQQELEREFGHCELRHLFRSRTDAATVAKALNSGQI